MSKYFSVKKTTAAIAIASIAALSLPATPAFARDGHRGGNHGYSSGHGGGYNSGYARGGHHNRGHSRSRGSNGGDIALAAGVGLLLGAVLMSANQPTYAAAPPPSAGYYGQRGALDATPTSEVYQSSNGQYCRDYQSTSGYGTACLAADGIWRTVGGY